MVAINYATREVSCKVVYYGPGMSGKTTNLQYVHKKVPSNTKGKLISLATDADRTLYFDFLPINIGTINGFAAKFQLYTVPGQVYYNATRKLVLRGVDGLVFVADSQPDKMDENIESLSNLKENLAEYGYRLDQIPVVMQYNKQDLPGVLTPDQLRPTLNPYNWPEFIASATEGFGVFDTLKCMLRLVLDKAKGGGSALSGEAATAAAPAASETVAQPQPVLQPTGAAAASGWSSQGSAGLPEARSVAPFPAEPVLRTAPLAASASPLPADREVASTRESAAGFGPAAVQPYERVYRPFPGNTLEDERRMTVDRRSNGAYSREPASRRPVDDLSLETAPPPGTYEQPDKPITPSGSPRMEPSLKKADRPHPKKRSFWKRLFGWH